MNPSGGPADIMSGRNADECCQSELKGEMSYGPDPLLNACRVEFTKSWDAPTCNTNKLIYTPDNEVYDTILSDTNINGAEECCQAAFEE